MKRRIGCQAEEMAAEYLAKKGYLIIARNYRTLYGELDIVCEKGNDIVFVEVRSKSTKAFGYPEESITARKIERIRRSALVYLSQESRNRYRRILFDVVAVELNTGQPEIRHIEGAF